MGGKRKPGILPSAICTVRWVAYCLSFGDGGAGSAAQEVTEAVGEKFDLGQRMDQDGHGQGVHYREDPQSHQMDHGLSSFCHLPSSSLAVDQKDQ